MLPLASLHPPERLTSEAAAAAAVAATTTLTPDPDNASIKRYYRLIKVGQGGIWTLPLPPCPVGVDDDDSGPTMVDAISTFGCYSNICIFIPLSAMNCFAAHVTARVVVDDDDDNLDVDESWTPTVEQGRALQALIRARLETVLRPYALSPDQPRLWPEQNRAAFAALGPRRGALDLALDLDLGRGPAAMTTASYVAQALLDVGLGPDRLFPAHGFIVDPRRAFARPLVWEQPHAKTGDRGALMWAEAHDGAERRPEHYGYRLEPQDPVMAADWSFKFFRDRWMTRDEALDLVATME